MKKIYSAEYIKKWILSRAKITQQRRRTAANQLVEVIEGQDLLRISGLSQTVLVLPYSAAVPTHRWSVGEPVSMCYLANSNSAVPDYYCILRSRDLKTFKNAPSFLYVLSFTFKVYDASASLMWRLSFAREGVHVQQKRWCIKLISAMRSAASSLRWGDAVERSNGMLGIIVFSSAITTRTGNDVCLSCSSALQQGGNIVQWNTRQNGGQQNNLFIVKEPATQQTLPSSATDNSAR